MLAAEIWYWWIGVVLLGAGVLTVIGLVVGYLKNVTALKYPTREQREQLERAKDAEARQT